MPENESIGKRIESRRKELDLTLSDISNDIGVAASTIQRYEKGQFKRIKMPIIEAIASSLKVNPEWLIGHTNDPTDYDDGDLIASIPLSYMEGCNGNVNKAYKVMQAAHEQQNNIIPITGMVPVVGRIVAGYPILASENIEGYLPTMLKNPNEYLYLRVKGNSMINAGIKSGALVLVHRQSCAENGDIVACRVNGDEATLKRFSQTKDMVILSPENPEFQPIAVSNKQFEDGYAEIIGVVKQVIFDI